MGVIERLSRESAGGGRPARARREAAELLAELGSPASEPRLEQFAGYSTFACPFAVLMALAVAPALLPRSLPQRHGRRWRCSAAAGLAQRGLAA